LLSSFIWTFGPLLSGGATKPPARFRAVARAFVATPLLSAAYIARTPPEMPPEWRWMWVTQRGVVAAVAATPVVVAGSAPATTASTAAAGTSRRMAPH
jgi:drug/metabolite transporter (DMT)-like permease